VAPGSGRGGRNGPSGQKLLVAFYPVPSKSSFKQAKTGAAVENLTRGIAGKRLWVEGTPPCKRGVAVGMFGSNVSSWWQKWGVNGIDREPPKSRMIICGPRGAEKWRCAGLNKPDGKGD